MLGTQKGVRPACGTSEEYSLTPADCFVVVVTCLLVRMLCSWAGQMSSEVLWSPLCSALCCDHCLCWLSPSKSFVACFSSLFGLEVSTGHCKKVIPSLKHPAGKGNWAVGQRVFLFVVERSSVQL